MDSTYPRNNRYTDTIPRVYFHIADAPAGFDPTSLYLVYGSEDIHYGDPRLTFGDDHIIFQATATRAIGTEFDICIADLADRVEFPAPNRITAPFCLHLTVNPAGVSERMPDAFEMITAYPNPFNSSVKITAPIGAQIAIYDLRGNIVGTHPCVRFMNENANMNTNANDAQGQTHGSVPTNRTFIWTPDKSLPSGIYIVRATIPQGQTHRSAPTVCAKRIVYLK